MKADPEGINVRVLELTGEFRKFPTIQTHPAVAMRMTRL
jgi:hypothetical protein